MTDQELLSAFESATISPGEFRHVDHVRTAWLYLQRDEPAVALAKYVGSIQRLVAALGAKDKYHETITWAYLLLIRERMEPEQGWEAFGRRNPDLIEYQPSILERYYSPELLASRRARERFVWPDRGARA